MSSEYRIARDGFDARVSGEWAKEKLYYAARYMSIFNGAMRNKWPSRIYIDLLAGPGRCISNETGEEFDGSPILALTLKNPFSDLVFVESSADLAAALRSRALTHGANRDDLVLRADANASTLISTLRQRCG